MREGESYRKGARIVDEMERQNMYTLQYHFRVSGSGPAITRVAS